MKYVIEHFGKVFKWHFIEYSHISQIVGKNNLLFTNIKGKTDKLSSLGKVFRKSIAELGFEKICILDPSAGKMLTPNDCRHFDYLVFGGILGDYPPRDRTREMLSSRMPKAEKRNIGKEQFPTDNAVYVAKQISSGKKFNELKFIDTIEIDVGKKLSVILPFRYASKNGKPVLSPRLVEFLKKRRSI